MDETRQLPAAANRARSAHEQLAALDVERDRFITIRREAVAALRDAGWTWQQVADLLGIHRNRAAHLLDGTPNGKRD